MALDLGGESDLKAMMTNQEFVLRLLLVQQCHDLREGLTVSNRVAIARLSRNERTRVKEIAHGAQRMPELMRDLMFPSV